MSLINFTEPQNTWNTQKLKNKVFPCFLCIPWLKIKGTTNEH